MNTILFVLVIYFIITFGLAWYFSRKESLEEYLINRKNTGLVLLLLSNIATIIGAGAVVAVVAEVYNTGISYGIMLPASLIFGALLLGLMSRKLKDFSDKHKSYTIVDFFRIRFDKKNETLVVILQLFLLTIWIAVQAVALASLASVLTGADYIWALMISAIITIAYTSIGGLKIDIITDFFQFWVFMILFFIMGIIGYQYVGSINNLFSLIPKGHLDPLAFGGLGFFIFGVFVSGFLFLGNTTHWQRIFSARDVKTAKNSFYYAIPIMLAFSLLVLFFGLLAAAYLSNIPKETALFELMKIILPPGLVGVGCAAILAVIMSSVDSLLVGGSTIIYNKFFSNRKISSARIITALFGLGGFLIAFLIPDIITLSLLVTYLALLFVPTVIGGLYFKTSANASFYSLLIPAVLLFVLYPFMTKNTFIVPIPLSILIVLFYDKIFKRS